MRGKKKLQGGTKLSGANKKQETIADIVAEMRDEGHIGDASFLEWVGAKILHYADRIEAAYNRLALPTSEQWTQVAQQAGEIDDLKRENARLRAALKPVLECSMVTDVWQGSRCKDAVRMAQHIYNGGGESEVKE